MKIRGIPRELFARCRGQVGQSDAREMAAVDKRKSRDTLITHRRSNRFLLINSGRRINVA